jgi:hypothetical protein
MSLIVICPHCFCQVEIQEINCAIFRHGIYKQTYQQIPPHSSKQECDRLIENNEIWGCGKPFRLVKNNTDHYEAIICDYI